jgi:hypothetical protein
MLIYENVIELKLIKIHHCNTMWHADYYAEQLCTSSAGPWLAVFFCVLSALFCVSAVLAVPAPCLHHYFVWTVPFGIMPIVSYTHTNVQCVWQQNIIVCLRIICSLGGRELSRGRMGYIRLCSFGGHSWSEVYKQPQLGRWNQGGVNKPDTGLLCGTTNVPYLPKYKMTFFHNSSYEKWELPYNKIWNWNMFCVGICLQTEDCEGWVI